MLQFTKEFWMNLVLFVFACIVLGLSIWALMLPCKNKEPFGDYSNEHCYDDINMKLSQYTPKFFLKHKKKSECIGPYTFNNNKLSFKGQTANCKGSETIRECAMRLTKITKQQGQNGKCSDYWMNCCNDGKLTSGCCCNILGMGCTGDKHCDTWCRSKLQLKKGEFCECGAAKGPVVKSPGYGYCDGLFGHDDYIQCIDGSKLSPYSKNNSRGLTCK